jgi:GNAT superfamily N-acetyltransferase
VITTRKAEATDAADVEAITVAAYEHYIERIGQTPAPMTADYPALIANGAVWMAQQAGEPVGVLVLVARADHLLLESVAVLPAAQGLGIGGLLLDLAEREAAARGLGEVRLYTNEAMTENLGYYPRRGYVETHRAVDNGFRRVYFRKPVRP